MANYDTFYFYDNLQQNETESVYILGNIENNQGIAITEAESHFRYAGYYIDNWNTARDGSGIKYLPGDLIDNPETNIFYAIWKKPPKYLVTAEQLEQVADTIRICTGTSTKLSYPWGFIERINTTINNFENFLNNPITNLYLKVNSIRDFAFVNNSNLTSVNFPSCTTIGRNAFYNCSNLITVNFPTCTTIGSYAFRNCSGLTSISFPVCTTIWSSAFAQCTRLTSISFPSCTTIENYAFYSCSKLTSIDFPICTVIGSSAFYSCSKLTSIDFPICTVIGSSAFYSCSNLTSISFPACISVRSTAFGSCTHLTLISFPACTTIGSNAFGYCTRLTLISFPSCTVIWSSAFRNCYRLLSAYFLNSSIPSLRYSNAFSSTPIAGYISYTDGIYGSIFVRASMLEAFKSATNWVYYSSRFVGLTDEEIAALEN